MYSIEFRRIVSGKSKGVDIEIILYFEVEKENLWNDYTKQFSTNAHVDERRYLQFKYT